MTMDNHTPIDDLVKKHTSQKDDIGSYAKEAEPLLVRSQEQGEIQEVVEHEPSDEEVKQFVTPHAESIKLPPDLKKLGLESVDSTQFPSHQNIKLPISDEEVLEDLKQPVTSTKRWLGELSKYILLQAHLVLKKIGGKAVRIIKN